MNELTTELKEENYIFFSIGTSNYAFCADYVLDIMQLVELEYPESLPEFIAGLLNYNNKMIKIVDIRSILSLDMEAYGLNSRIIIVSVHNETFGIIVGEIQGVKRINTFSLSSPPYDTTKSFLEAIYTRKEFSSTVINLENIEKRINKQDNGVHSIQKSASICLPKDTYSKEILHRRRLHYVKKMKEAVSPIIKSKDAYITFVMENSIWCVKILHVAGFYKFSNLKITKIPCTPDFILGVSSIKGRYITIVDLLSYVEGKKIEEKNDLNIIVVEYEDYNLGIVVNSIGETMDINENEIKAIKKRKKCLIEYVKDDLLYLILDIKKLFGDEKLYVS